MNSLPDIGLVVDLVPAMLISALVFSTVSLVVALCVRVVSQSALYWAAGSIGVSGGILLIVLRGQIPDVASILVANWVLLAGYTFISCGTSRLVGRPTLVDVALGISFCIAFSALYFANGDLRQRSFLVAGATCVLLFRVLHGFVQAPRSFGTKFAMFVLVAACLVEAVRAFVLVGQGVTGVDPRSMTGLSVRLGVPGALGISIALVIISWPAFRSMFFPAPEHSADGAFLGRWSLVTDRSVLITPSGRELRLTGNEYLVLKRLGASLEPLDRLTLNAIIGRDNDNPKDRGIDILLSRLRRKCAEGGDELPINSVRGRGYVFHGGLPQV